MIILKQNSLHFLTTNNKKTFKLVFVIEKIYLCKFRFGKEISSIKCQKGFGKPKKSQKQV